MGCLGQLTVVFALGAEGGQRNSEKHVCMFEEKTGGVIRGIRMTGNVLAVNSRVRTVCRSW